MKSAIFGLKKKTGFLDWNYTFFHLSGQCAILEEVSSNVSISSEPLVHLSSSVSRENLNNMEIEDNDNFHNNFTQSNLVVPDDPTMVSRIFVCPLCEAKAAAKTQVENHLVNFHRMSLEVMNKKGIEIESVLMFLP